MPPAAVVGDKTLQPGAHCHNPGHPVGTATAPIPHPAVPLDIMPPCSPTVKIGGKAAARQTDQTKPCSLSGCVPGGPGVISKASGTVKIDGLGAARVGDMTNHAACSAPIPAPTGTIQAPGITTVNIGG